MSQQYEPATADDGVDPETVAKGLTEVAALVESGPPTESTKLLANLRVADLQRLSRPFYEFLNLKAHGRGRFTFDDGRPRSDMRGNTVSRNDITPRTSASRAGIAASASGVSMIS